MTPRHRYDGPPMATAGRAHAPAAHSAGPGGQELEELLEEIEADRRLERRLVWQSLIAVAVVAAVVVLGQLLAR